MVDVIISLMMILTILSNFTLDPPYIISTHSGYNFFVNYLLSDQY
jgi:hypothetical protein